MNHLNPIRALVLAVAFSLVPLQLPSGQNRSPKPFGPSPSARQLRWHEMEFYGFLHFTVNTFTDKEWGYGDESPSIFNPTAFDADQIVRTAKAAGMKGLILTAKHHDDLCRWPSKFAGDAVKHSAEENGKVNVVKEIPDAPPEDV